MKILTPCFSAHLKLYDLMACSCQFHCICLFVVFVLCYLSVLFLVGIQFWRKERRRYMDT